MLSQAAVLYELFCPMPTSIKYTISWFWHTADTTFLGCLITSLVWILLAVKNCTGSSEFYIPTLFNCTLIGPRRWRPIIIEERYVTSHPTWRSSYLALCFCMFPRYIEHLSHWQRRPMKSKQYGGVGILKLEPTWGCPALPLSLLIFCHPSQPVNHMVGLVSENIRFQRNGKCLCCRICSEGVLPKGYQS